MLLARIGAALYFLWGVLHILAAYKVYVFGQTLDEGMLQGRIFQDAWNLLFFAFFAMVIAIKYNWHNHATGYWLALFVISMGDIGFIVTILIPGYLSLIPGIFGPLLWLLALGFSSVAMWQGKRATSV